MSDHEHMFDLMPVHALDAVHGDELRRLEEHLDGCAECVAELGRLRAAAAATVPDLPAPAHVWDRILAEIASADATSASSPTEPDAGATLTDLATRRRPRGSLGWMIGGIAAVTALVLGTWAILQQTPDDPLGPEATVAAAEAAADQPDAIVSDFVIDGEAIARVVLTADGEGFVLPADLDSLGSDRTYQLWVVTPDELVISAGVLGGEPAPSRFTWNGDVTGFVLTREVAGGVVSSAGDVVATAEA